MPEEKFVVTVKYNDVEIVMSEWGDLLHAALHADALRHDGYKNVTVKRYTEVEL